MNDDTESGSAQETPQPHISVPLSECALARGVGEIGDGWMLLILREVVCGATRFGLMQKELGISRAVLSDRLDLAVERGLLARVPVREPGRRAHHTYQLTEKGRALLPVLVALREWSERHLSGPASRLRLRTRGGAAIGVQLVDSAGRAVDPGDVVAARE